MEMEMEMGMEMEMEMEREREMEMEMEREREREREMSGWRLARAYTLFNVSAATPANHTRNRLAERSSSTPPPLVHRTLNSSE